MKMALNFHENTVITGYVDSYCLVCDSYLKTKDDILSHIAKPIHKKNLDACTYIEKYKNEHIRKIKKGYYCDFCNLLVTTAAKVGLHVTETKHIDCRKSQMLRRIKNAVVAFEELLISEKSWNGLSDDACTICNTEFDNELIHKNETSHLLGLVQSKFEVDSEKNLYRKVDDTTFYCLTCNVVDSIESINSHFIDPKHKEKYQECQKAYSVHCSDVETHKNLNGDQPKETPNSSSNKVKAQIKESEKTSNCKSNVKNTIMKQASEIASSANNVNERCTLNKRSTSPKVEPDDKMITKKEQDQSQDKVLESMSQFQKNDNVTFENKQAPNKRKKKAKPARKDDKTEKKDSEQTGSPPVVIKPPTLVRQPTSDFLKTAFGFQNEKRNEVTVNLSFRINLLNFWIITINDFRLTCPICDTIIESVDDHITYSTHKSKFFKLPVLISLESEFIREIRPGLFHCGYCNQIEENWKDLENHLKSTNHKESKTLAFLILEKEEEPGQSTIIVLT